MSHRMSVGWFSPIPPAASEIATHTQRLRTTLDNAATIHFWADGLTNEQKPAFGRTIGSCGLRELNETELNIFNIGNHAPAHAEVFLKALRRPGVIILHDTYLRHFFAGLYLHKWRDGKGFVELMESLYGNRGATAAQHFIASHGEHIHQELDCVEAILPAATAIIVHSRTARQSLAERGIDAIHAPLPYPAGELVSRRKRVAPRRDPIRLIMCGYLGFNRRIREVIRALGTLRDKQYFKLDIYGIVPDELGVDDLVAEYGLQDMVEVKGFVSEKRLSEALEAADLALNLRYPTMGEASASQLRFWERRLPSIVTRTGWYAEQPPGTLAYVRLGHEVPDLQHILLQFLDDPEPFHTMAETARKHLEETHGPEYYVNKVLTCSRASAIKETQETAARVGDRISRTLAAWGPVSRCNRPIQRSATIIKALVDGALEPPPR